MAEEKKKPVVDEMKAKQQYIKEHAEMYAILQEGLLCASCKSPVSSKWDACPGCGGKEAMKEEE